MGSDPTPAAIDAYFAAVNARDFSALEPIFAEDVELRPVGSPPQVGREAALAYYPRILTGFAESHDQPVRVSVAGRVVTVEIAFTGTTTDGAAVRFDAVDVFDLGEDGRISRISLWYDTRDVVRQVRAAAPQNA